MDEIKQSCHQCGKKIPVCDAHVLFQGGRPNRYCEDCVDVARADKRKRLEAARRKSKRHTEERFLSRLGKSESLPLESVVKRIKEEGITSLNIPNLPFRLKRGEKIFLVTGNKATKGFELSLALTNTRLFYSERTEVHKNLSLSKLQSQSLSVAGGVKTFSLASVIALDEPSTDRYCRKWSTGIHLANGMRVELQFSTCQLSRQFFALIAELIDRINDPIDENSFVPTRERILDEVKISVWRRDGGVCVKCGSRNNLEYDHIIPVSKGGSNTARNIELLCETCNRRKSNHVI